MVHLSHSIVTLIVLVHFCMDTVSPERRIFKGRRVEISEFPFFVTIVFGKSFCGGSIISSLWIATARHCLAETGWVSDSFINIPFGTIQYVYAGNDLVNITTMKPMSPGAIERRIKVAVLHPNHDIAVAKLNRPFNFNETVQPILLPRKDEGGKFTNVSVCGFGTTETGHSSPFLKASEHNFQESDRCFEEYLGRFVGRKMEVKMQEKVTDRQSEEESVPQVCVARKGGEGICLGDSGGPLVARRAAGSHVLAGIAISGSGAESESGKLEYCSDKDTFSFFIRTSSHLDWIYSIAGENLSH